MTLSLDTLRKKAEAQWFYKVQIKRLGAQVHDPRVELAHWRPRGARNFGDELSVAIVERMLTLRGLHLDFCTPRPRRMLGIGSILMMAREGDTVWGSGVNGRNVEDEPGWRSLDVRSVRGPLTRDYLARKRPELEVPGIFGDPGLLLYDLFPSLRTRRTLPAHPERILIPNLNDLRGKALPDTLPIVSPLEPWPVVAEYIAQAKEIVTSSLHGLVLGHRLGKNVKLVRFTDAEPPFKYEDYALGAGLSGVQVFDSVEAALRVDLTAAPVEPSPALTEAFPYDLWEGAPAA